MIAPALSQTPRKLKVATVSLAGCFGCHTSFLDIDERLFDLIEHIEFDRSPLTDIKQVGACDIGLIEGGLCNAENVLVLREFRVHCKTLVAVGACAITGGLPAQRNRLDLGELLTEVYRSRPVTQRWRIWRRRWLGRQTGLMQTNDAAFADYQTLRCHSGG